MDRSKKAKTKAATASKAKKPAATTRKAAGKRTPATPRKRGRPTVYSPELAELICKRIATSRHGLRAICQADDIPSLTTIMRWLSEEDKAEFREQYARAREAQADLLAEEILQIADDGQNDSYIDDEGKVRIDHDHIARSRLRVDARKWLASKLAPKKYGDRITAEHTGAGGGPIQARVAIEFVNPPPRPEGDDG